MKPQTENRAGAAGEALRVPLHPRGRGGPWKNRPAAASPRRRQGAQALAQGGDFISRIDSRQLPDRPAIFDEFKSHAGPGQRGQGQVVPDVGRFGLLAAQEFSARGQIEKELADFDAGAPGAAAGLGRRQFCRR
jgi:hypothetical protein